MPTKQVKHNIPRRRVAGGGQFWKQPAEQIAGPAPDSAYYKRKCDLCDDKAIYRWGQKAVCRAHLSELDSDLRRASDKWESHFGQFDSRFNKSIQVK